MTTVVNKLRPAKYKVGQAVRAVKGPGGALQPEPCNLGRVGTVVDVQQFARSQACYVVAFSDDSTDTIDENCLEKHHACKDR